MNQMFYLGYITSFFETVLIILVVIYGLRFISKLLAPWMMKKARNKIQSMAEEQMRQRGVNPQNQKPEGSVTVEKTKETKSKSKNSSSDDDYVEFEVIE
ncbi:MAG TPA: hypothetical protein DHU89_05950 [Flavobacteriales bacterium]|nr:hypothetical protein [Flavobacteriales bacterium]|tara:strand:- start:4106 stop:4402 length:297 start_codon:yes stop_codon:yes gene_type:complete